MMQFAILEFGFSIGGPEQKKIFRSTLGALLFALCSVEQPTKFDLIINLRTAEADRRDDSTQRAGEGG